MVQNLVIGVVGKPSSGKSTFLNATTDAKAKVGNYPFTTIEPNRGVSFYRAPCACSKFPKFSQYCAPKHGKCVNGVRYIPVELLDVAGLIPGAAEGLGLGNKFLDDLRHAHVLIHVVDVSGTTNEKGEATEGYDPSNDIDWLNLELHSWIFNNLWGRWDSIVRRHKACKCSVVETLTSQLSGYGCSRKFIIRLCDKLGLNSTFSERPTTSNTGEPTVIKSMIETWDEAMVKDFVWKFLAERFPTIYALNKIDLKSSSKNIIKLFDKYDQSRIVLTSALSECFLRHLAKSEVIEYHEGDGDFITLEEAKDQENKELAAKLKPLPKAHQKEVLENIRDFVLFRYGSTGVYEAVSKAVELEEHVAVYPVQYSIPAFKQLHDLATDDDVHINAELKKGLFQEVWLAKKGASIRHVVHRIFRSVFEKARLEEQTASKSTPITWFCEGDDGRKLGETETVNNDCTLIRVVFGQR